MYRINGHALLAPSDGATYETATAPSSHSVAPSAPTIVDTIGGKISIEPPSGRVNTHTWIYDQRSSAAVALLKSYIGNTPLCVIDTYDDAGGQLTNIVCVVTWPEIKSANKRDTVEAFSLVFVETSPQS